ncbi:tRNA pseudouridine(38/39) synthase isoform X2 [Belonocnema kinseyi]|uniref:tRNA pseudouridine(38/39) synthase isoform X2 n=1 Tax=Belonocnema kinseyi TaxID=2817044 RepID=UPI00143DF09F|nr:tRNA pseudouridine(38/39) synthase isoform X2 [Belonocnema kinseyi]
MHHKRHILLKFYYLGWDYQGFMEQESTISTIEYHLFAALVKSCCIESRESSNYHRCGRTDKGVSAFSQVISIDIRSRLDPEHQSDLDKELPYCKILNRILPKNIRCISWCPAPNDLSARFDCKCRTYKYFFPRGNLNIEVMNTALKYMIGSHDFRNICKMDVANGVVNFIRTIKEAFVRCIQENEEIPTGYDMCELTITSQAFLWHQIRCIMGVLLLIGREKEKPEVIQDLFDVEKCPRKPQYNLAHEVPLNLFHCEYETNDWFFDKIELEEVVRNLQEDWTFNNIKSTMIKSMLMKLPDVSNMNFQSECLLRGVESKTYKPLMERLTCESLEEKIKHFSKKQKIEVTKA